LALLPQPDDMLLLSTQGSLLCVLLILCRQWDTKVTSLVAMAGGIGPLVREALSLTPIDPALLPSYGAGMGGDPDRLAAVRDAHALFVWAVDTEWSRVFANMTGEELDFARPTVQIGKGLGAFPSCSATLSQCQCVPNPPAEQRDTESPHIAVDNRALQNGRLPQSG
jgi:hypothetical protein